MDSIWKHISMKQQHRADSFDSVESFDVVSYDDINDLTEETENGTEWEDLRFRNISVGCDSSNVELCVHDEVKEEVDTDEEVPEEIEMEVASDSDEEPLTVPVPSSALALASQKASRELLRNFYLTRAKSSMDSSKSFNATPLVPPPVTAIAPLRSPERYSVEVYEHVIRQENATKAQKALQAFYAEREMQRQRRRALNRVNEVSVEASQVGIQALTASCSPSENDAWCALTPLSAK